MGVDYYQCDSCNYGYRDDNEYACWCDCGNKFCNSDCGKLENFAIREEPDEPNEDVEEDSVEYQNFKQLYQLYMDGNYQIDLNKPITCVICRNEKYTEYTLFQSVLKHFNITREQAIEIWKVDNKNGS